MKNKLKEQIEHKKFQNDQEKKIDIKQGLIWHKDSEIYIKNNQEISNKIKLDEKKNESIVLKQIKEKENRKLKILPENSNGNED